MAKGPGPRFNGVRPDERVPVQFVDRKAGALDGGKDTRKSDILNVGSGAELEAVEEHGHAPCHRPSEGQSQEVRHLQAFVVHAKAATAGKPDGAKDWIGQGNVVT